MKISIKLKVIILSIIISIFSFINYGNCSDNVSLPPESVPAAQAQSQESATVVPQSQPVNTQTSTQSQTNNIQPPALPPNIQTGGATGLNQGFLPSILNMIKSLSKVIFLILAIAGVIVIYRRMKSKVSSNQKVQESENKEPTNLSEAVSSFVKHKIKRTS